MKPGTLLPSGFYEDEIRIQHDGTVWIVASHLDVQHRFDYLADAMTYANQLRDRRQSLCPVTAPSGIRNSRRGFFATSLCTAVLFVQSRLA
jgi:hypothetical protein